MLNFGASKPRVKGGPGPPLDPHLLLQYLKAPDPKLILLIMVIKNVFKTLRVACKFLT